MRQAHPFLFNAAALLIATASSLALADTPETAQRSSAEHSVFSPTAPTLPLQHQPLATSTAIVAQPSDWKAANAAVAIFARGHADVIKWEKSQSASEASEHQSPHQHPHGQGQGQGQGHGRGEKP